MKKQDVNEYGKVPLTEYEDSCMWMSYRYCIGRHTIAAHAHAHDLARNCYKRMSHDRMKFIAKDIRKEMADSLSWTYNFRIEDYDLAHMFEIFGKMINDFKIHDNDRLCVFANLLKNSSSVTGSYNDGNIEYEISDKKIEDSHYNGYATLMDYEDLLTWQYVANLFDIDSHHIAHTTEGDIEFFYVDVIYRTEKSITSVKRMIPVDMYLNGSEYVTLNEEYIKSID